MFDDILQTDIVVPDRPGGDPEKFDNDTILTELIKCKKSPHYFIHNYIQIKDDRTKQWIPMNLWPCQINVISAVMEHEHVIVVKARQIGLSTLLGAAMSIWEMLFVTNSFKLILSKSEREAQGLLVDRLKKSYYKLPSWMKPSHDPQLPDSKTELELSNGAKVLSLPTSGGDSYTATTAMVDEAALVHQSRAKLSDVLLAIEPTISAGGKLWLVSKPDKSQPGSTFNNIFQAAVEGKNDFYPIYIPWQGVPWRDEKWYQSKVSWSLSIDGTLDSLHENYSSTWQEALRGKSSNKRLSPLFLSQCYEPMDGIDDEEAPQIPELIVYKKPSSDRAYIVTADAAEGNPQSDPSPVHVWEWDTGEQVAVANTTAEPSVLAGYVADLSKYYRGCPAFPERNNHGHTLISWLREEFDVRVATGPDHSSNNPKFGYNTNALAKAQAYSKLAEMLSKGEIIIHHEETYSQLGAVEGRTLRGPGKSNDDNAICTMLFAAAKKYVHLTFLIGFVSP